MIVKLTFLLIFFTVFTKGWCGSDCYFSFLESQGSCSSDSDCNDSPCVMDITSSKKVCCKRKAGTIAPECPAGSDYKGLPVLCDLAEGDDGCPFGYSCVESSTEFTKNAASPNSLCCKS